MRTNFKFSVIGISILLFFGCGKGSLSLFGNEKVDPDLMTNVILIQPSTYSLDENNETSEQATLFRFTPIGIDQALKNVQAMVAIEEGRGSVGLDGAFVHLVALENEELVLIPSVAPGEIALPIDRVAHVAALLFDRLNQDSTGTALVASATISSVIVYQLAYALAENYENSQINDAMINSYVALLVAAISEGLDDFARDDYQTAIEAREHLRESLLHGLSDVDHVQRLQDRLELQWFWPLSNAVLVAMDKASEQARPFIDQARIMLTWLAADGTRLEDHNWLVVNLLAQNLAARITSQHSLSIELRPLAEAGARKALSRISREDLMKVISGEDPSPDRVGALLQEFSEVEHEEATLREGIRRATCFNFELDTKTKESCEANGWNWFVDDLAEQVIETCDLQGYTATKDGCLDFCDLEWHPSQCLDNFFYCGQQGGHDPSCF